MGAPALPRTPCSETPDARGLYITSSGAPGWRAGQPSPWVPGTQAGERTGASFMASFFLSRIFFFFFSLDLHISLGDSYVKGMKTGDGVILNSFWVLFWDLLSYGPFCLDNVYFFIFWPCCVACGILVPRPEIKPHAPAVKVQSLNHWTAREVPSWGLNV